FRPVTTELRLWCYTHDSLRRPPSQIARYVIKNMDDLLSTDLNTYFSERVPLTPAQQDALREQVTTVVSRQLKRANSMLAGTVKQDKLWNGNQTKLFLGLMNKILPDMTAHLALQYIKTEQAERGIDPSKLTIDEL